MPMPRNSTLRGFVAAVFLQGIFTCLCFGQAVPDFTQAQAMVELLRSCRANRATKSDSNRVLSLPGTRLIIDQQNISRRVTPEQYREVLEAACFGKIAGVRADEPGTRSQRGVAGLTQDVAPSLIWGRDHVEILEARLAELRSDREIGDAIPLARKYLPPALHPELVKLTPRLYVVMGGRASAAAIDDQLYFDVLISAWRASQGALPAPGPLQVVEFFAHETHHLGYGQILDQKRDSLRLNPAERRVWDFLSAVLMEGSATLLINGHERLDDLAREPDVAPYLARVPELMPAAEAFLRKALDGNMTDEAYDESTAPFLNMGYHATGAVLLAAIERDRGLSGVMDVMADPRRLLSVYNQCAGSSTVAFKFEPRLAAQVAHMGDSAPR